PRAPAPGEPGTANPRGLPKGGRRRRNIRRYPQTLAEAIKELEGDEVLRAALGPALAREFLAVRAAEWEDLGNLPVEKEIAAHFRRYGESGQLSAVSRQHPTPPSAGRPMSIDGSWLTPHAA